MPALDPNVARQSSEPFRSDIAPHDHPDQSGDHADDHNEFSQFAHCSETCANQADIQGAAVSGSPSHVIQRVARIAVKQKLEN
jgi:hypothetical protein